MGGQVESTGYARQYTGKACRLTSTTLELGRPRTFDAHGYADGDGGDATPFLPRSLFSTEFVTAAPYEFLAFVSNEPGTIDVNGVHVELEGAGDVYTARVAGGEAGERISSSVPVWAVLEDRQSNQEQLLYGNIGASPVVDIDRFTYRLFVARAQSMPGYVASIADGNELSLNGAVVATLNAGDVWTGDVSFGDVFSAQGPIYGVVDDRTADGYQSADAYAMIPGRMKGTQFAIANDRRNDAQLYVYCLETACHVIVSTSGDAVEVRDMEPGSFEQVSVGGAFGATAAIVVTSGSPIVLAIGNSDLDNYAGAGTATGTIGDYIIVPPDSPEVFGIASTQSGVAGVDASAHTAHETCSDGSSQDITIPPAGQQLQLLGYSSAYNGKACKYTSVEVDEYGRPKTLTANSNADGDGGSATPFLPRRLFSTEFAAPIAFTYMAFVSDEAGTLTIERGDGSSESHQLEGANGVFKFKLGAGEAGTLVHASVPVWAMVQCAVSLDEQLLYGNIPAR